MLYNVRIGVQGQSERTTQIETASIDFAEFMALVTLLKQDEHPQWIAVSRMEIPILV